MYPEPSLRVKKSFGGEMDVSSSRLFLSISIPSHGELGPVHLLIRSRIRRPASISASGHKSQMLQRGRKSID